MVLVAMGDQQALARVFARYSRLVYSVAYRVLNDTAAAEDVMQEIFLQIWRNPTRYLATSGGLRGWLIVLSRNRAIDVLRGRRPTEALEDVALATPDQFSNDAERHILLSRVRSFITDLPENQRYPLELAFFEGCTHQEIASKLNQPLGTVKTRIRTALQRLEEAFNA